MFKKKKNPNKDTGVGAIFSTIPGWAGELIHSFTTADGNFQTCLTRKSGLSTWEMTGPVALKQRM